MTVTKHSGVVKHFSALCPYLETNEIEAVLGYSVKQKKEIQSAWNQVQSQIITAEQKGPRKTARSFTDEK